MNRRNARIQFNVKKKLMENVTSKIPIKINVIVRYKKEECVRLLLYTEASFSLYSFPMLKIFYIFFCIFTISSVMLFYLSAVKSMISYGWFSIRYYT